jgi:hypothetical protein
MPAASALLTFTSDTQVRTSETRVPAADAGEIHRIYVENSGEAGKPETGAVRTGVAIGASSAGAAQLTIELTSSQGTVISSASLVLNPNSDVFYWSDQIPGLESLAIGFEGMLRISSDSAVSVTAIRSAVNSRRETLWTATPALSLPASSLTSELIFPQMIDGGGYSTRLLLSNGTGNSLFSGDLLFFNGAGQPLGVSLQRVP